MNGYKVTTLLPVGIFIIGTGNHWFTIIQFDKYHLAWNLNSLLPIPEPITNLELLIMCNMTQNAHHVFHAFN